MQIEVSEEQLKALATKACEMGQEMGIPPDRFAIMLSMVAKYLSDAQGIEVSSARGLHS